MKWNDITVKTYQSLFEYIREGDIHAIVCELNDMDMDELEDMDVEEADELLRNHMFILNPLPKLPVQTITIDEHTFTLTPFTQIEFGAFIDIERIMSTDTHYIQNIHKILPLLYRILQPRKPLSEITIEPYGYWGLERQEMFRQRPIIEVFGAIHTYLEFRDRIFKGYKGLFAIKEDEEDEPEEPQRRMTAEERKLMEKEKRVTKWGYELLLFKLASNDPLRVSEASGLGVATALNLLSMLEELQLGNTTR